MFITFTQVNCRNKKKTESFNAQSLKKRSSRKHGKGRSDKMIDYKKKTKDEINDKCLGKERSKIGSNNGNVKEPEFKPLNEKEAKIMNNEVKADENEYPTMMDAADGFKNTPTIDTTGNNKSHK